VTAPLVFSAAECEERSMRSEVVLCMNNCFPVDAKAMRAASAVIMVEGSNYRYFK
jgi:hypothetical protein